MNSAIKTAPHFATDEHLLALSQEVLSDAGFACERVSLGADTGLLAENEYSIIALTTTATVAEIEAAESALAGYLGVRTDGVDLGAKVWDMHLVMLSRDECMERGPGARSVFEIAYDTSQFRRIIKVGVFATPTAVRGALSSFMDLPAVAPLVTDPYKLDNGGDGKGCTS